MVASIFVPSFDLQEKLIFERNTITYSDGKLFKASVKVCTTSKVSSFNLIEPIYVKNEEFKSEMSSTAVSCCRNVNKPTSDERQSLLKSLRSFKNRALGSVLGLNIVNLLNLVKGKPLVNPKGHYVLYTCAGTLKDRLKKEVKSNPRDLRVKRVKRSFERKKK